MTPLRRCLIETSKRPTRDWWITPAPDARLGKHVKDISPALAERLIACQEEYAECTKIMEDLA